MSWPIDWQAFHLLRPWWLLALLPMVWIIWKSWQAQAGSGDWSKVVDAELLPHLLEGQPQQRSRYWLWLLLLSWLLATLALAGPTWKKQPQPLYMKESALVILLDLSRSMDANDITPSRLTHARLKVLDILEQRKEGQTGLVVYTNEAFVVAPLTDDNRTIANLVPALSSDIMPSQGSRLSVAIERANQLLDDAGFQQAQLLVISDGVDDQQAYTLAKQLHSKKRSLSVLAIGSDQGSPIPLTGGGFLKDNNGAIVIAKADHASLQELARAGDGRYTTQRHDGSDLATLFPSELPNQESSENDRQQSQQQWQDEGIWLILPLLLFAALAFRRGWLFSLLLCSLLIQPQTSYALEWDNLWQTPDQKANQAMQQQQFQQAAEQFENPMWKGSALYRSGEYEQAAEVYSQINSADAHYNRGNALARAGRLEEAGLAYDEALKLDPEMEDARANKEIIEQLKQQNQQQNPQSNNDQQGQDGEQQQGDSQQQGEQGQQQSQQGEQSSGDSQTSSQSEDQQPSSEASQSQSASAGDKQQQEESQSQSGKSQDQKGESDENKSSQQPSAAPEQTQPDDATDDSQTTVAQQPQSDEESQGTEQQQYLQQWLRRIPDDPGGLLRRKFEQQHQQQSREQESQQPW